MNNKPIRILLIEDNPGDARLIQEMITEAGKNFELQWVDGLSKGLEHLSVKNTDIILLDLTLPDSQGMETFTSLYVQAPMIPIIVMSGLADENVSLKVVRAGAQDYLVKGQVNNNLLMRAIHYAIERKKTEEALKKSNQEYKSLAQNIPGMVYKVNPDWSIKYVVNSKAICGYSEDELLDEKIKWMDIIHPDDKDMAFKGTHILTEKATSIVQHYSIKNKDGRTVWVEDHKTSVFNEGIFSGVDGVVFDVTSYKEAEEAVRRSTEFARNVLESVNDAVSIVNVNDLTIDGVNKAFLKTYGFKEEEVIGKRCYEITHQQNAPCEPPHHICPLQDTVRTERHSAAEHVHFNKAGKKIYSEVSTSPIKDETGKIVQVVHISRDITERKNSEQKLADAYKELKETQEQLIQSGKMAAMGQLAAGVSHELNQPLTGIKGFAQAILMDIDEKNPVRADLNKIIEQANRMDKIIQHVRFFARRSEFVMRKLDINQPIEDSLMLLNEQLRVHNIRVKKSLNSNLPGIQGDPNQFEQVFLNLITNAKDAIDNLMSPDGGELIVKTSLSRDKKNIEILFEDTGCGIPKENLEHIFNPFFTTKSPEGGIGLGLSIVYRIIENHKGKVEVESEEGKGTAFKITLPTSYER